MTRIGIGSPDEWLRVGVRVLDEAVASSLKLDDGTEAAALLRASGALRHATVQSLELRVERSPFDAQGVQAILGNGGRLATGLGAMG